MKTHTLIIIAAACSLFFLSCKDEERNEKIIKVGNLVTIEPYKGIKFDMVFVEGGTFYMGSQNEDSEGINYDPDARPDEAPVHKVTLDGYYIATTEVTQELWRHVTGGQDFDTEWGGQFPAYNISFEDARKFFTHINTATGLKFRLPTEAEWEYAARGGKNSQKYKYPGSNNIEDVAWYWQNSNDRLYPVATKRPNELGIYDMSGNVREWCADWADFYTEEDQVNPKGPSTGHFRIMRGGSRYNNFQLCRSTYRNCQYYYSDDNLTGFRLVLDTAEVNKMLRMQK
ncbi:MAG: SUMF1/EgtB/PvdO family nonheme iron enzyme [Bacteroidales bacterium]|nr:SUMF1/EgtB/PvdO family nonheme iron enzyme [Bacteroidales bacterium]